MTVAEEDPFDLIKKGNAFEASSDHWRSAEFYSRASICLCSRADDLSSQIRNGGGADGAADTRKVVSLFRAQSLEYMYKARHCLIEALRFENDQDRSRTLEVAKSGTGSLDPLYSMLTPEESEKRRLTFERLFSGVCEASDVKDAGTQADAPIESTDKEGGTRQNGAADEGSTSETTPAPAGDRSQIGSGSDSDRAEAAPTASTGVDDRRQSIESRLAQLDSSLLPKVPPPFISGSRGNGDGNNQNRLDEIQRGLKSLGVSLPDSNGKKDLPPVNLSTEDEVKLIIQQAKDEVRVENGLHGGEGGESNGLEGIINVDDDAIDENDSMFEGFEDDDDDMNIEALLAKAENLVAKTCIEVDGEEGNTSSEFAQIRKVQALLLEARLCLEIVQAKSSSDDQNPPESSKDSKDVKEKEDVSDDKSEESAENEQSTSGAELVGRNKARKLVENAQHCMEELLKGWK